MLLILWFINKSSRKGGSDTWDSNNNRTNYPIISLTDHLQYYDQDIRNRVSYLQVTDRGKLLLFDENNNAIFDLENDIKIE